MPTVSMILEQQACWLPNGTPPAFLLLGVLEMWDWLELKWLSAGRDGGTAL